MILPKNSARKQVAGHEFDFYLFFVFDIALY